MKSWAIYIIAALGFMIYGATTKVDRDGTGAIVGGGTVDAFNVKVGDCFDDSSLSGDEISSVPGVPCADPHDNEAYAVLDLTLDSYPGMDEMGDMANASCVERFEPFIGKDYESSSLDIFAMYPSVESWAQNDREVICAVYDMEDNKLEGSMKGRNL